MDLALGLEIWVTWGLGLSHPTIHLSPTPLTHPSCLPPHPPFSLAASPTPLACRLTHPSRLPPHPPLSLAASPTPLACHLSHAVAINTPHQPLLQTPLPPSPPQLRLPALHRRSSVLDFAPDHAHSYNSLVDIVRRNLLLADWCAGGGGKGLDV